MNGRQKTVRCCVALCVWAGAALSAQGQTLALACPPGAAAGDPATPLTLSTGTSWEFSYGNTGTWAPAYTSYRHVAWLNPAVGTWLTPGPVDIGIATTLPFLYRSPVIQVDATRVDLASIVTTVEQASDNLYNATGIVNAGTPAAGTLVANTAGSSYSVLSAPFTPALPWLAGGNQLLLQATNFEAQHTSGAPTGVYATITLRATCLAAPAAVLAAVPADHPWALMLAALGVVGLAARRRRAGKWR